MRNAIGKIVLLAIYAKATTANMTADKLKELRRDYEKSIPLSDEELEVYESTRDLYAELKQAAKDI